jgi:hypothetical protein
MTTLSPIENAGAGEARLTYTVLTRDSHMYPWEFHATFNTMELALEERDDQTEFYRKSNVLIIETGHRRSQIDEVIRLLNI